MFFELKIKFYNKIYKNFKSCLKKIIFKIINHKQIRNEKIFFIDLFFICTNINCANKTL